ncbi:hypothetical protein AAVH_08726 [Aphelenchoides avenae]|nr:hypothetical protein AAVH_08726 [Aphelenchus avenae]
MNTDIYVEVLGFLDRYSLDAARLANAAGNELVGKHLSTFPLRVLESVVVESGEPMRLSGSDDESEHKATFIGMDHARGSSFMESRLFDLTRPVM